MCKTMPLIKTYMYDLDKTPLEGWLMLCKTMPLIRTYMYDLDKTPLKGLLTCIKENASN